MTRRRIKCRTCNASTGLLASTLHCRCCVAAAAAAGGGARAAGRLSAAAAVALLPAPQPAQLHQVLMLQLIPGYGPQHDAAIGGNGRQLQLVARGALPCHLPNWVSVLATPWCGAVQRLAAACRHSRAGLGQSNELQALGRRQQQQQRRQHRQLRQPGELSSRNRSRFCRRWTLGRCSDRCTVHRARKRTGSHWLEYFLAESTQLRITTPALRCCTHPSARQRWQCGRRSSPPQAVPGARGGSPGTSCPRRC